MNEMSAMTYSSQKKLVLVLLYHLLKKQQLHRMADQGVHIFTNGRTQHECRTPLSSLRVKLTRACRGRGGSTAYRHVRPELQAEGSCCSSCRRNMSCAYNSNHISTGHKHCIPQRDVVGVRLSFQSIIVSKTPNK